MHLVRRLAAGIAVAILAAVVLTGCFGGAKAKPSIEVHFAMISTQTVQNIYQMEYNKYAKSIDALKKFDEASKAGSYPLNTDWDEENVYLALSGNGSQYILVGISITEPSTVSMQYVTGSEGEVTDADFVEFGSVDEYNASETPIPGLEKPKL